MLKRRAIVLCLVVLMLALPVVAAAASHVKFEDDNLEAAVIKEFENLGKGYLETKIPQDDMKLLEKVFAWGPAISGSANFSGFFGYFPTLGDAKALEVIRDLTGLQYASNLEALDLRDNFIKDLTPVQNLKNLQFLDISGNNKKLKNGKFEVSDPAFSYNPSSKQMRILQEIQHRGAVVRHDGPVKRISGPDRYETAIRIWQNMYTDAFGFKWEDLNKKGWELGYNPGDTIILARGDKFADALVAAPLAYSLGKWADVPGWAEPQYIPAPILLTSPGKLQPVTKTAILDYIDDFDLSNLKVYVLGGTAAVSENVVNELIYAVQTKFDGVDVKTKRISGKDRYETSVEIAKEVLGGAKPNNVVLASGDDNHFADALAVGPYAAIFEDWAQTIRTPILLTPKDSVNADVEKYLKKIETGTVDAVLVGGSAAISEKVFDKLLGLKYRKDGTDKKVFEDVTRVWGEDRYETSVKLFDYYKSEYGAYLGDNFFIATGADFADALTGSVLAANNATGILLVPQNSLPKVIKDEIVDGQILTILGGEAAVSEHNAVLMYNQVRLP